MRVSLCSVTAFLTLTFVFISSSPIFSAETYPESMRYPTSLIDPDAFVYDK